MGNTWVILVLHVIKVMISNMYISWLQTICMGYMFDICLHFAMLDLH